MAETATPTLSLKNLLVASKDVEVEYPGFEGFKVNLAFLSRETLVTLRRKASKTTFKNRQPVEEVDDKLFLELYVNSSVKGWSGFKMSYLEQLAPVNLTGVDPANELAYTAENALFLMKNSSAFDSFVSEIVTELTNFTKTSTLS